MGPAHLIQQHSIQRSIQRPTPLNSAPRPAATAQLPSLRPAQQVQDPMQQRGKQAGSKQGECGHGNGELADDAQPQFKPGEALPADDLPRQRPHTDEGGTATESSRGSLTRVGGQAPGIYLTTILFNVIFQNRFYLDLSRLMICCRLKASGSCLSHIYIARVLRGRSSDWSSSSSSSTTCEAKAGEWRADCRIQAAAQC